MPKTMFILYVADQKKSRDFYNALLGEAPVLDVPGMTEFKLGEDASLGLMPENGIASILGNGVPHPSKGSGIPRCELYLFVEDTEKSYSALIEKGGRGISKPQPRPWGDTVAYGMDLDGHIITLAKTAE